MKKLLIASALVTIFGSSSVFAQAKNFEGFNVQASTGYQHNKIGMSTVNIKDFGSPATSQSAQDTKKGNMALNLGLGYTFAISEKFTLGGIVEWNPLNMKTGSGSMLKSDGTIDTGTDYNGRLKNQFSIAIVPGYAFSESTLGYVKLGWTRAKARVAFNKNPTVFEANTNGLLIGLGAKHLLTKNIYGFAEANYARYSSKGASGSDQFGTADTNLKPTSYNFLVGLGARF